MIDFLERPITNSAIVAASANTINKEEFVNEISIPPNWISAIFDISNWCIGSIGLSAAIDLFFSYFEDFLQP